MSMRDPQLAATRPGLLESLIEGFQIIGFDYAYVYLNPAAARHGRREVSSLTGRTIMECYPGIEQTELFARLTRCLEQRVSHVLENEFRYDDGTLGFFELRIEPVPEGACVLSIDISERKAAEARLRANEERLRHAERLESVGMLAAGVAHDFNNLLGVILGYGEIALTRPSGPRVEDIQWMMAAARRSAALTRQLLAYGRRQVMHSQIIDPVQLISDLKTMLSGTLESGLTLSLDVSAPVGQIEVDPSKLEQVVMNLVLNAKDALPQGRGIITIGVQNVELDHDYVEHHHGASVGPHVVISVSDTGVGMDKATLGRVFEPFFTTKSQGRGTGLGLATVYGIVKQSGGDIWVYSEPGLGTTFRVYFPRSEAPIAGEAEVRATPLSTRTPAAGTTVVVAEDDSLLSAIAEECLVAAGFRVLVAASSEEALQLCSSQRPVAALVTDIAMPGIRGPELITSLRRFRPDLKVLCTSGYAFAALKAQQLLPEDVSFLEKPYLPSALVHAVRQMCATS